MKTRKTKNEIVDPKTGEVMVFQTAFVRLPPSRKIFQTPSRTKESFREQCDVNRIVKRYTETGELDHTTTRKAVFGDFENVKEYQEQLEGVRLVDEMFSRFPAEVRDAFQNDPARMLEALDDPAMRDAFDELGLNHLMSEMHGDNPERRQEAPGDANAAVSETDRQKPAEGASVQRPAAEKPKPADGEGA